MKPGKYFSILTFIWGRTHYIVTRDFTVRVDVSRSDLFDDVKRDASEFLYTKTGIRPDPEYMIVLFHSFEYDEALS